MKGRKEHPQPDSCLQSRKSRQNRKKQELSANTMAFIDCKRRANKSHSAG